MSKIQVRNIPKYLTNEGLRDYFSQRGEVTYSNVMRNRDGKSRQLGYVKFRTELEALEAVSYFKNNKCYIDTCRITCEIAREFPWRRPSLSMKQCDSGKYDEVDLSKLWGNKAAPEDGEKEKKKWGEYDEVLELSKLWANSTMSSQKQEDEVVNDYCVSHINKKKDDDDVMNYETQLEEGLSKLLSNAPLLSKL